MYDFTFKKTNLNNNNKKNCLFLFNYFLYPDINIFIEFLTVNLSVLLKFLNNFQLRSYVFFEIQQLRGHV